MGKNQHSKDRMFITATEHKELYGGYKSKTGRAFRALPFDRCALGLTPFETPVCTRDGTVFDIMNIIPWIKEHGVHPVTGKSLSMKDLIRLKYQKNAQGKYVCALSGDEFTQNSKIVAIATSGNVYSYTAIRDLNIKLKSWTDLVSGEPFQRSDIIVLQDPKAIAAKQIDNFYHVKHADELQTKTKSSGSGAGSGTGATASSASSAINSTANRTIQRVLDQVKSLDDTKAPNAAAASVYASSSNVTRKRKAAAAAAAADSTGTATAASHLVSKFSTGRTAASFTSTAVSVSTEDERADVTDAMIRKEWYRRIRRYKKSQAFVSLQTSLGRLNIVLFCSQVPETCHNFLLHCKSGYYSGTVFHRLIPGFMIQGGDPKGTGRGGESAFPGGKAFADEYHPSLKHDSRGILSMANSGTHTNKSQFFITFGACSHLDRKHSVFGKVVGGKEVLNKMEAMQTKKDRPIIDIRIIDAAVYDDPYDKVKEQYEKELEEKLASTGMKKSAASAADQREWFSNPAPESQRATATATATSGSSGVGQFIDLPKVKAANRAAVKAAKKKRKISSSAYGDFSNF
jgi:peptidyl-prolyl cis-trans isomerase-like 2